jgi:ribosomal protein L37AE/L43A
MPKKKKINLADVLASLHTTCPKCGCSIPPDRVRRIDFEQVVCPECGERFTPAAKRSSTKT